MLEDSVPVDWAMADRVEKAGSWGNWRVTSVETKLRNMVSKEKRRFKDEKYDLDLTYINDKIIAMGFPSSGSEVRTRFIFIRRQKHTRETQKYTGMANEI